MAGSETGAVVKAQRGMTHFEVSAPLVMSVLMRSSCPYRAAMCRGVLPCLSSQSISAPACKTPETTYYFVNGQANTSLQLKMAF